MKIITLIITGIIIILGIYNVRINEDFLKISIGQILTLLIAIGIAFWATQRKNDERKTKEQIEKIIERIRNIILNQNFYSFETINDSNNAPKIFTINVKKLKNSIDVLKKYNKNNVFNILKEIEYIERQVTEYNEFVSEKITNSNYLFNSKIYLRNIAGNIESKCDYIIVKLYT